MLAVIDKDLPDKIKPDIIHENQTHAYETVAILDADNRTFPQTLGYELHPERMVVLNKLLAEMPGQKFMLPKGLSKTVWEALAEDANWLCTKFLLPEYQFLDEDLKADADIWRGPTLDCLRNLIPGLSPEYRRIILRELLKQAMSRKNKVLFGKRITLLNFVLTHLKEIL